MNAHNKHMFFSIKLGSSTDMITNSEGYFQLIHFLSDNLSIFENVSPSSTSNQSTVGEIFSDHIATNTIAVCSQHPNLSEKQRFQIIREIDAIVHDMEEVLSSAWDREPSSEQMDFIEDFIGLTKNLFDTELQRL